MDKKFELIRLKETKAHTESIKENAFEGWYSKFQVADYEKTHDHPLSQAKLNTLPCKAHPVKEWADLGKKEYYYTSSTTTNTSMGMDKSISVEAEGNVQEHKMKELTHNMAPNPKPPLAIQDSGDAAPIKKGSNGN